MIHSIPESVHAILSPSKAHQWINCTGSLGATRGLPNRASRYAAEGTVYHDVARRALQEGKDCAAYVGDEYQVGEFKFTVDSDNADSAQRYVDAVRAIPGKRFVEVDLEYSALLGVPKEHVMPARVDLSEGATTLTLEVRLPVAAGTGDCVVLDYENTTIHSHDLKFGRGDVVYASEIVPGTTERKPNPQLALYAAAAVARYELMGIDDSWTVSMAIHQPRVGHYDEFRMTVGELRAWVTAQRLPAQAAYAAWCDGPEKVSAASLTPGEKQCRWCPLSGSCTAQRDKILNMFPKGHAEAAIPKLTQLDDVELAEALDRADEVEHWLSAVRSQALARALGGATLPNWKLVEGRRGNRSVDAGLNVPLDVPTLREIGVDAQEPAAITVEDAVHFALGNGAYKPRELLTVAKLQKPLEKKAPLLWAALQEHITQPPGKPGIVRLEDPRPPVSLDVLNEFPIADEVNG